MGALIFAKPRPDALAQTAWQHVRGWTHTSGCAMAWQFTGTNAKDASAFDMVVANSTRWVR